VTEKSIERRVFVGKPLGGLRRRRRTRKGRRRILK
jgi:hypothetical protein